MALSRRLRVAAVAGAAAAATLVLLVGVTEAVVRASWEPRRGTPGLFLSHPTRGQRLAPGYEGWFAGVPVRINALGFRDARDYDLAKPPGTFRILVLGDSVTFGHGSVFEHTYPYLTEQRLRAWRSDIDWQVWNLGVPGYNTSQELQYLLEVGPRFDPDLVVVGFFENDIYDNRPPGTPGALRGAAAAVNGWLQQHLYSYGLYKRAWFRAHAAVTGEDAGRRRLAHVAVEESLLANVGEVQDLDEQRLSPVTRFTDAEIRVLECPGGDRLNPDEIASLPRIPGWEAWRAAVARLQALHRQAGYGVAFFVNSAPRRCPDGDIFHDGGSSQIDRHFLGLLGQGTPAASTYREFLHHRPSEMPLAAGHSLGNANRVKADVLFRFLRDEVLPPLPAFQALGPPAGQGP